MDNEQVITGDSSVDIAPDPVARARGSDIQSVIDLLNAEGTLPETPDPGTGPAPEAKPEKAAPLTWKAIAERLGVDQSELYGLKVKTGDGSELSVEQLKDAHKASAEVERLRGEVTKGRAELEADRIRNERNLSELLGSIRPDRVDPELRATWQKQQQEYLSRERESMLRTIPEWVDSAVIASDRAQMLDAISPYGFTTADLENVTDHRLLRLVRDFAKAQAKAKAEAKPPPVKVAAAPSRAQPQTQAQQFGRVKSAVTRGQLSPQAAVEKLLRTK